MSPAGPGARTATETTRAEDLNIVEFMRADMHALNKEEDQLQKELRSLHLNNLHKHHQVVSKNKIDTNIKTTQELVRKLVTNEKEEQKSSKPQLHEMQSAVNRQPQAVARRPPAPTEDDLEQSLENLDMLLANMKAGVANKERALHQLGQKFNLIEDPSAAAASQPRRPSEEAKAKPMHTAYSKPQPRPEPAAASESEKGASLELKKSNLDRLPSQPMTYQQPFQVSEKEHTFITGGALEPDEDGDSLQGLEAGGMKASASSKAMPIPPPKPATSVLSGRSGRSGSQSRPKQLPRPSQNANSSSLLPPIKQQAKPSQSSSFPPLKGQVTPKGSQRSYKQAPIAFSFEDSPQPKRQPPVAAQ